MAKIIKSKSSTPAKVNGGKTLQAAPAPKAAPAKPIAAKPAAAKAAAAPAPAPRGENGKHVDRDAIARRAFEYFQARGCQPGHELEDWLMAEKEILGKPARQ
ncbi:MAG: DUF2934 domain-containing protein [Candidatus Wallbacteria bacterium]|nr:DUF2934 domain-containing protein [Candidatus Wallbacteria bacterium]